MGGRQIACLAFLLAACTETPPAPEDAGADDAGPPVVSEDAGDPVDFDTQIEPMLVENCSFCHEGAGSRGPMFLELGNYETSVLGHPMLVVPGQPSDSLILIKGEHDGPAWLMGEAALIRSWILQLQP